MNLLVWSLSTVIRTLQKTSNPGNFSSHVTVCEENFRPTLITDTHTCPRSLNIISSCGLFSHISRISLSGDSFALPEISRMVLSIFRRKYCLSFVESSITLIFFNRALFQYVFLIPGRILLLFEIHKGVIRIFPKSCLTGNFPQIYYFHIFSKPRSTVIIFIIIIFILNNNFVFRC